MLKERHQARSLSVLVPAASHLVEYRDALTRGWSPDNTRGKEAIDEQLAAISEDPAAFLALLNTPYGHGKTIKLPDGSLAPRLPGIRRWMWDGGFCGSIGFRWDPGTSRLPPHVMGHIGFSVVPWRRGRGYATEALRQMLDLARERGLQYVELTTDPENLASQKVVLNNGGTLVEQFSKPQAYGGSEALRFRIMLND
jgi:predicted acetyltransferase